MEKFYWFVIAAIGLSIVPGFIGVFFGGVAQYGRHDTEAHRFRLPMRLGWFVMEAPALAVFVGIYVTGKYAANTGSLILLALWVAHYFHRAIIYPLQMAVRPGSTLNGVIVSQGIMFCSLNGFVNAFWISHLHEYHLQWPVDLRFAGGAIIFFIGYYINKRYDRELARLRRSQGTAYAVCEVGLFKYIVSPNYLGEILTWVGFAIAAWSLPSMFFVITTIMSLAPRAGKHLQWYRENFPEYGRHRKAIVPFIW